VTCQYLAPVPAAEVEPPELAILVDEFDGAAAGARTTQGAVRRGERAADAALRHWASFSRSDGRETGGEGV
jgi:hypothetical protein